MFDSRMQETRIKQAAACAFVSGLLALFSPASSLAAEDVWKMGQSRCDVEWDKIKSIAPMSTERYERWWEREAEPKVAPAEVHERIQGADMYYYMARVPYVIGRADAITEARRDIWLEKASSLGHKAARATLMRKRYLGNETTPEKRVSRQEYLMAARAAAEVGDPEFAAVMMDTARNYNRAFHCRPEDAKDVLDQDACDPQKVTDKGETSKWAELAAWGGHPEAKILLCRIYIYGLYDQKKDDSKAFQWCFAAETTACASGVVSGLLQMLYREGRGTTRDSDMARMLDLKYPLPRNAYPALWFPYFTK